MNPAKILVRKTVASGAASKKGTANLTNGGNIPGTSSALHVTLAGGLAGGVATVVGHPFDTLKVRIQTETQVSTITKGLRIYEIDEHFRIRVRQMTGNFSSSNTNALQQTFNIATKIVRNEGVLGFYKGMLYPILSQIPTCAATFYGYHLGGQLFDSIRTLAPGEFSNQKVAVSGCIAGVFNAIISCPIERIKCLLQIQTGSKALPDITVKYNGPFHCARQVYVEGGLFSGSYKGFGVTLLRRAPGYAIHFLVYENMKRLFRRKRPNGDITGLELFICGGVGGFASCLYWIAPDTLKTRIQTSNPGQYPHGMRSVLKEMKLRREPFIALYRGLPAVVLRAFPVNSVYMFSYEYFLKGFTSRGKDRELR